MGAVIDNDGGAIIITPLETPAIKELPVTMVMMSMMILIVIVFNYGYR